MKGRIVAALVVACLAVALGIYMLTDPADRPTARRPGHDTATATPTTAAVPAQHPTGARLWRTSIGELVVDVPDRAYFVRESDEEDRQAKPAAFHRDRLTVPAKVGRGPGDGEIAIFGVNQHGRVNDVIVLNHGTLSGIQWMVSRHGVELVWEAPSDRRCTVERDNTAVAKAHGYFRDSRIPRAQTRYAVTCEKPVRWEYRGKTRTDMQGWHYIFYVGPWDDSVVGEPVQDVRVTRNGDIKTLQAVSSSSRQAASEHASFLEWNAFISDDHVNASLLCRFDLSDERFFGGDGRAFAAHPAADAYTAKGRPRSKISTRVGSSFDLQAPLRDLNGEIYDDWIYKGVGTSHAYNEDLQLIAIANAGTTGIDLVESWSTTDEAHRKVKASAGNPLCELLFIPAPPIDFTYAYHAWRDGRVMVEAIFDKAPDTELLWQRSSDMSDPGQLVGGCLYRFENRGFINLAAPLALGEKINVSFPDPSQPPPGCVVN